MINIQWFLCSRELQIYRVCGWALCCLIVGRLLAHLGVWGQDNRLFHRSDPTVTPYIHCIHRPQGQRQLFPRSTDPGSKHSGGKKAKAIVKVCAVSAWTHKKPAIRCFILLQQLPYISNQTVSLSRFFIHSRTVRGIDETQTDYLVWMAFPEWHGGQHNNSELVVGTTNILFI